MLKWQILENTEKEMYGEGCLPHTHRFPVEDYYSEKEAIGMIPTNI
jgi:hypothetical protein